jgi:hypothetical protein
MAFAFAFASVAFASTHVTRAGTRKMFRSKALLELHPFRRFMSEVASLALFVW